MRNNEYTATPNWFKQESTGSQATIQQTNYYFGGSTSSGSGLLSSINLYNKYIINTYKLTIDDLFIPNTAIIAVDSELPEGQEPSEDFVSEIGNSVSVQDWHTSYSIRVISGTIIKANLKANTFRYGIVFYDEHNTPISGYTPTEDNLIEISVPETANYFRCCHYVDPALESDPFYVEYQSVDIYDQSQLNEVHSGVFNDFTQINNNIQEGITKSTISNSALNLIFQQPLQFTTDTIGNIRIELDNNILNNILKDTLLSDDYVTTIEDDPQDILSQKNFKQGLKINGIEVVEKNGFILIKGNLATTGGITAYTDDPDDPGGSGGIGSGGTILDIEIKGEGNTLINAYLNEDKSILNFDRGYLMDLTTEQTSTALKTFTEGIKIGDTLIKVIDGVLTLDCSLAVTGGITAYALGEQIASSIMDAIVCDGTTITVVDGKLTVIGGTGGASNWDELEGKPSWITNTKPTYTWGEITQKPTTLSGYGISASDVLNTLKNVDGSGSGLDADTLDSYHASGLLTSMSSSRSTNLSVTVGGTTKTISSLHADYAYSLYNSVRLWGNTFDGTQDLSGTISISGTSQLLFSSYGGGFYMTDSDWVRVYGNKKFYCGNNVQVDGNINAGRIITGNKFVANGLYTTALNAANVFVSGNAIYDTSGSDVVVAGGKCRPIIRWKDNNSNGWRTRYLISSAREDNNSWGRLFIAVSNSDAGTSVGCSFSLYGAGYAKIEGNLLVTGGGTFYSSDIKAKTIIGRPKLSLNSITNAPIIRFKWNGYKDLKDDGKLRIGGIAQYIEKILPECVVGQKEDFLSFDYATVGYVFSVQTARHLQSYETKTDREIKKLKNRITFLEKQLRKLSYEEVDIMAD